MATPFIDVLTDAQRTTVEKKSRKDKRPYYYDGTLAETQARLQATGGEVADSGALVQISEDLEAALILMPADVKQGLLSFTVTAVAVASGTNDRNISDDYSLMEEVVAVRTVSYQQVNADVGKEVLNYDYARGRVIAFIENVAHQKEITDAASDPTSVVIPDLGVLFSALSDSYRAIAAPDILAVHDRISDQGLLYAYQNAALHHVKELSSWINILTLYLV